MPPNDFGNNQITNKYVPFTSNTKSFPFSKLVFGFPFQIFSALCCYLNTSLWFYSFYQCVCVRTGMSTVSVSVCLQFSAVGCCHCPQQSESSSILPFTLCPMIAYRWLLSSAHTALCVWAGAQTQPPGKQLEPSRTHTHISDRCMMCHYPPLIIILPLLFILWATLAFFLVYLRSICTVALQSDRCSWGGRWLL